MKSFQRFTLFFFFFFFLNMNFQMISGGRSGVVNREVFRGCARSTCEFTYEGDEGPEHWGELCNPICSEGKEQSPIDIKTSKIVEDESLEGISVDWNRIENTTITNNGHTVQVNCPLGSTLRGGWLQGEYELVQFHMHRPSEHSIDGVHGDLELHFVHESSSTGQLAVVGFIFQIGDQESDFLHALIEVGLPSSSGETEALAEFYTELVLSKIGSLEFYRYNGSLTAPDCTEGVSWFLMKDFVNATQAQIDKFNGVIPHENNRPKQALNGRKIYLYSIEEQCNDCKAVCKKTCKKICKGDACGKCEDENYCVEKVCIPQGRC